MAEVVDLPKYILTNFPVLVKSILSFLSAKDLFTCARVCQQWRKLSDELKRKREGLSCLMVSAASKKDVADLFNNASISVQNSWSVPRQALVFLSAKLYHKYNTESGFYHQSKRLAHQKTLRDLLKVTFPNTCDPFVIVTPGVIGSERGSLTVSENENGCAMSAILFPHIPGVTFHRFSLDPDDIDAESDLKTTCPPLPPNAKVMLYLFNDQIDERIAETYRAENRGLVIAGGYVEEFFSFESPDKEQNWKTRIECFVICGDNVKVRCALLGSEINTPAQVKAKLMQLKKCGLSEERSFAIHVVCCGRGAYHYDGQKDVESRTFRAIFPRTPLLGFFGSGEVGCDCLRETDDAISGDCGDDDVQMHHGYTSVVCLVSIE